MKSLSILFLSFALMMFSKTNAQWYSPQKDNLIFKESKGHWQLPVTNYREVWSMKNVTMRLQCAPKPTIEFYIDTPCDVKAVFSGKVLAIFSVGQVNALMTRFGDYFITYSNLDTLFVKKGDSVQAGQVIGKLNVSSGSLEMLLSDTYDKLFDPYPWFDWKNAPAPSGNSGNKH